MKRQHLLTPRTNRLMFGALATIASVITIGLLVQMGAGVARADGGAILGGFLGAFGFSVFAIWCGSQVRTDKQTADMAPFHELAFTFMFVLAAL